MIDAFVEGTRSVVQACHMVILFPVAMVVLAGRARWQVVAGAVLGIVIGGWVFMTRWLVWDDTQIRWSSLLVITATVVLGVRSWTRRDVDDEAPDDDGSASGSTETATSREAWASGAIAGLVAFVVTTWWRPCVGRELGDILTTAPREPWGQFFPSVGFMLGVSLPIIAVGLVVAVWQPTTRAARRMSLVTATIGVVLAASVLAGQHGEIVATLFEWSEPFV